MFSYINNDMLLQTIGYLSVIKNDRIVHFPINNETKNDLQSLEEDVKIEEDYLEYLFHHNRVS